MFCHLHHYAHYVETSLRLITPPTDYPATLDELKRHIRLNAADDSQDEDLTQKLQAATATIQNRTCLKFMTQTWAYDVPFWPSLFALPLIPVSDVSIVYYPVDGGAQTAFTDFYLVKPYKGTAYIHPKSCTSYPTVAVRPDAITVTMTLGFDVLPDDAKHAVLLQAGQYYLDRTGETAEQNEQAITRACNNLRAW